MRLETRSYRAWYGRLRHRWYLVNKSGDVRGMSARSYSSEQEAWESGKAAFSAPVTMVYDKGGPDEYFELYAAGREFDSV